MRRFLLLAVVGFVIVVPMGAASGQTALSPGCSELNNPVYDETGILIDRVLTSQSYLPGEMVTVTYDFDIQDTGVAEPNSAFLSLAVAGQFNNPVYAISPAGDGSLTHVFTGNEDGIGWELNDEYELGSVTVVCVAAQVPPTTTTAIPEPTSSTTIPEVETDIADSGSTGVAAAALVVLGLLVLGVATVRSYRSDS